MKTVIGIYSTLTEANKVKAALQTEGYKATHINVIDQTSEGYAGNVEKDHSFTEKIKNFFTGLGDHSDEHLRYANRIKDGKALLAVTVPDDEADFTADLLSEHGAIDIQEDSTGTVVSAEQVIPVVQEELVVGKKQVNRGGVRVYSHVVETPVSTDVSLRNEQVVVDRRPVDRAATPADFSSDSAVIEVLATGEEAVVGKSSRVVEEVRVGKQATEHNQEIKDTVRHTEVDVEPTAADKIKR